MALDGQIYTIKTKRIRLSVVNPKAVAGSEWRLTARYSIKTNRIRLFVVPAAARACNHNQIIKPRSPHTSSNNLIQASLSVLLLLSLRNTTTTNINYSNHDKRRRDEREAMAQEAEQ
jgi:hypothetical protein